MSAVSTQPQSSSNTSVMPSLQVLSLSRFMTQPLPVPFLPDSLSQYPFDKACLSRSHHIIFRTPPIPCPQGYCAFSSKHCLAFTIFPTSQQDLNRNDMLWHAVKHSSFPTPQYHQPSLTPFQPLPQAHFFSICVPHKLAAFLNHVSLVEMRQAVIYMLADAAQGESEQGLQHMEKTLAPTVWTALKSAINGTAIPSPVVDQASFLLDAALTADHSQDLWRIEIVAGIFAPGNLPWMNGTVLASMYEDWSLYTPYFKEHRLSLLSMIGLIRQGRQADVWERIYTILLCTRLESSYISLIPDHIVESLIIPYVLYDEGYASLPRKRSRADLFDEVSWEFRA